MVDDASQRAYEGDVFLADIGTGPLIVGILNVTPDSFFDGGRYIAGGATLARVRQMVVDGCDIVDIGAASTRPEASAITAGAAILRVHDVEEHAVALSFGRCAARSVQLGETP